MGVYYFYISSMTSYHEAVRMKAATVTEVYALRKTLSAGSSRALYAPADSSLMISFPAAVV